ncbi:ATP-binding protein [Thiohalomonas denitrificans]|uniref:histidine kinase n=1 Tax=Thiohalomonas denitrificans TaxID=415747 RepID=A0A1G5Q9E2_9GAMM|nr:ATP-binding protein [Thiohalomonas denitrificans]SCZ58282.1 Signal transduction histidine kinase [Thiohalomonas denitrificans]
MSRLLPATLSGRLFATLLAGLLLAQILGAVVLLRDRAAVLYKAGGVSAAQRIGDLIQVLDRLDHPTRSALLPVLNSGPLQVRILEQAPPPLPDSSPGGQHVRMLLRRLLGPERPQQMVVSTTASAPPTGETGPSPGRQGVPAAALLIVQAQLWDDAWVRIEHRVTTGHQGSWPLRLLLTLIILLASVVGLTLLIVRWLTRPLAVLATAAEGLGRDIHHTPLAETGPAEVRRAAAAFNTMQARLRSYIHERERTLAAISHDLRTPITRLRLRAELINHEELRAKVNDDLVEMEEMTAAALDLLRGVNREEPVQPVDMMALLGSLQADHEEAGEAVVLEGTTQTPYPGRPLALKRLFANLLGNALNYGGQAGVRVDDRADRLEVTVADRGPGIPEAQLETVFEPFYRLERSRSRETGGVGLGLAVARDIARLHGGELHLQNRTGGGLEAVLTLPR